MNGRPGWPSLGSVVKETIKKMSISELVDLVKVLRAMAVEFDTVETQEEADLMNKADKILGLSSEWKIGDKFVVIEKVMGGM